MVKVNICDKCEEFLSKIATEGRPDDVITSITTSLASSLSMRCDVTSSSLNGNGRSRFVEGRGFSELMPFVDELPSRRTSATQGRRDVKVTLDRTTTNEAFEMRRQLPAQEFILDNVLTVDVL